MNTSISIRTAELDDLKTLLKFEQGAIKAARPLDPFIDDADLHYYNVPELITAKKIHFIVATIKTELIACGYIKLENSQHYHKNPIHGYVGFIYVKPSFRGQRISVLIIESLKHWSIKKGLKESRLDTYSNNIAALKSYKRFSFKKSLMNMRMDI